MIHFLKALLYIAMIGFALLTRADNSIKQNNALPIDELRTFSEVFEKIKNDYVESIDDKQLIENAIRGMMQGLDQHSNYLDNDTYQAFQEEATGEFGGLGIEVGIDGDYITVISPIDDTPAKHAGIESGDLIIRLDNQSVKGMSLDEAIKLMRGKPGSQITLTIIRKPKKQPLEMMITRDTIAVKSVRTKTLDQGFVYARVSSFQSRTPDNLRQSINQLKKDNDNQLKGFILDLRNNPGGVLNSAVDVADLFLESGLIVYTEGRARNSQLKFNAKPVDILADTPIIVLVNNGSASASEIVAGALQDLGRAIIMGESTFGKGSVQTILPMNNQAALKLTTALYYTPLGRSIQTSGITPDIVIEDTHAHHMIEGNSQKTTKHNKTDAGDDAKKQSLAETDYQLYEALNVLKGLAIYSQKTK